MRMTSKKDQTRPCCWSKMLNFRYLFPLVILAAILYSVQTSLTGPVRKGGPPPVDQVAKMARYIVHHSQWMSLAYNSKHNRTLDYPMARVYSTSDGLTNSSTGIPYLMASPLDETIHDLMISNNDKASVIMSLSQSHYCYDLNLDPEDPRCAQVILTGKFVVLKNGTTEYGRAKNFLWTKHPAMENWTIEEPSHNWQFAKLQIHHVCVLDTFGGRKFPTVADYFRADPDLLTLHSFQHHTHAHKDVHPETHAQREDHSKTHAERDIYKFAHYTNLTNDDTHTDNKDKEKERKKQFNNQFLEGEKNEVSKANSHQDESKPS